MKVCRGSGGKVCCTKWCTQSGGSGAVGSRVGVWNHGGGRWHGGRWTVVGEVVSGVGAVVVVGSLGRVGTGSATKFVYPEIYWYKSSR